MIVDQDIWTVIVVIWEHRYLWVVGEKKNRDEEDEEEEIRAKHRKFTMLKLVLVFLVLVESGLCWKPVAGPSSYSHLTNHHPVMGTHNTIIEGEGAASIGHSVTYHGNLFAKQHEHETEPETVLLNDEPGLGLEDVQGRVLSGHVADYENKFLDGGGLVPHGEVSLHDPDGPQICIFE